MWRVEEDWVTVPLAEEQDREGGGTSYHHPFLLYSRHEVLPSLTLPGSLNILTLAWDPTEARLDATTTSSDILPRGVSEETPFEDSAAGFEGSSDVSVFPDASPLKPLPPLTPYRMTLTCRDVGDQDGEEEGVVCEVRVSMDDDGDGDG